MKKRLISLLLTVLMVASLFGGLSVSAYADSTYQTITYTIKDGDTLLSICNKNGLNWYSCEAAINKLNNLTSAKYRYLSVGSTIKLPASNEDAVKVVQASSSSNTATTLTNTSTGTTSSVVTTSAASNASIVYWLIPYTMQKGETVVGVCNTLGINFSAYSDQIKSLNNISSWSKVNAGTTLYLPSTSTPSAGTTAYAVVAHSVTKGETAYSICQQYGTSYNSVTNLMAGLNPKTTMTNIKSGSILLVPVTTTVTTGTTLASVSSSTTTAATTTTSTSTSTSTSSSTTTSSTTSSGYSLSSSVSGSGTITFSVNGATVTKAAAGAKVYVKVTPTADYSALSSISIKTSSGTTVTATDGYFTMPSSNVTVTAVFTSGYYIGNISEHGSAIVTVNGVQPVTAAKGVTVKVNVVPESGYTVSKVHIIRNDGTNKEITTIKNGGTFTMPDCRVFIKADFDTIKTYDITAESNLNGTVSMLLNNTDVTKAAAGELITINPCPVAGYEYDAKNTQVYILNDDGTKGEGVVINDYQFYMPKGNVVVVAAFKPLAANTYSITVKNVDNGHSVAYTYDEDEQQEIGLVTSAKAGEKIYLKADYINSGYHVLKYIVTANGANQTLVPTTSGTDGYAYFYMPSGTVTVTPVFEGNKVTVTEIGLDNNVELKYVDGIKVTDGAVTVNAKDTVRVGDTIDVYAVSEKPGYTAKVKVAYKNGDNDPQWLDSSLIKDNSFTVPCADQISIWVYLQADAVTFRSYSFDNNVKAEEVNLYETDSKSAQTGTAIQEGTTTLTVGQELYVTAKCNSGYTPKLSLVYIDLNGKTQTTEIKNKNTFTIPECTEFSIKVDSVAKENTLTVTDEATEYVTINYNGTSTKIVDKTTTLEDVPTGATVTVTIKSGKFVAEVDNEKVTVTKVSDTKYTFVMPAGELELNLSDQPQYGVYVTNDIGAAVSWKILNANDVSTSKGSVAKSAKNTQISGYKEGQQIVFSYSKDFVLSYSIDGVETENPEVTPSADGKTYTAYIKAPTSEQKVTVTLTLAEAQTSDQSASNANTTPTPTQDTATANGTVTVNNPQELAFSYIVNSGSSITLPANQKTQISASAGDTVVITINDTDGKAYCKISKGSLKWSSNTSNAQSKTYTFTMPDSSSAAVEIYVDATE